MKIIFSKLERFLLRNHQIFVLNSSSDGSDIQHEDSSEYNSDALVRDKHSSPHLEALITGALERPGQSVDESSPRKQLGQSKRTSMMHQLLAMKALGKKHSRSKVVHSTSELLSPIRETSPIEMLPNKVHEHESNDSESVTNMSINRSRVFSKVVGIKPRLTNLDEIRKDEPSFLDKITERRRVKNQS